MHDNRPNNFQIIKGVAEAGSVTAYAKIINKPRRTVAHWHDQALKDTEETALKEDRGEFEHKTYIITSAQIGTRVDKTFLKNLELIANNLEAEILISGITYNKNSDFEGGLGNAEKKTQAEYFDTSIRQYLVNQKIELNSKITLSGNLNISPTAVNPLSSLATYNGSKSSIIPHPKIALESVATSPDKLAKMIMTTGSVTEANFIQKKAGIKAEFHHQIGAVIVEIVNNKQFHYRHILAEKDGSFYDLTDYYKDGAYTTGHRVDAVIWGDIHHADLDPEVAAASWGKDTLSDVLKPRNQIFHDLLDFKVRNHHDREDDIFMKTMNTVSVREELVESIKFINNTRMTDCKSYVVKSNHDHAFTRWVKEVSHFNEPDLENSLFLLQSQAAMYKAAIKGNRDFDCYADFASKYGLRQGIYFLKQDQSCLINGIESGMHGHLGLNGSRGSTKSFTKIGTKCNTAHSHSAAIIEGVYTVGCTRTLRAGYAKGPSSWSHTSCIQYPNGKRTLITCINGSYFKRRVNKAKITKQPDLFK